MSRFWVAFLEENSPNDPDPRIQSVVQENILLDRSVRPKRRVRRSLKGASPVFVFNKTVFGIHSNPSLPLAQHATTMVTKKNEKHRSGNPTYSERALRAFVTSRAASKKHAVHVLTVKAEILRNARKDGEDLPVNWYKRFVSPAGLNHLMKMGAINRSTAPSTYSLTPRADRVITSTLKDLGHSKSAGAASLDAEGSHTLFLNATQQLEPADEEEDDDDDEGWVGSTTPSKKRTPRKSLSRKATPRKSAPRKSAPRTSTLNPTTDSPAKPFSKWNKAELIDAFKAQERDLKNKESEMIKLKKSLEAAEERVDARAESSALTSLDDDRDNQQEDNDDPRSSPTRADEEEHLPTRGRIDERGSPQPQPRHGHGRHSASPSRSSSPSPIRLDRAAFLSSMHPFKHPQAQPGAQDDATDRRDDDPQDFFSDDFFAEDHTVFASSPVKPSGAGIHAGQSQIKSLLLDLENSQSTLEEKELRINALNVEISSLNTRLETTLEAQATEKLALSNQVEEHRIQLAMSQEHLLAARLDVDAKTLQLDSFSSQVKALEAELETARSTVTSTAEETSVLNLDLAGTRIELNSVRADLVAKETAFTLEKSVLSEQLTATLADLDVLRDTIAESVSREAAHIADIANLDTNVASLKVQLDTETSNLIAARNRIDALEMEVCEVTRGRDGALAVVEALTIATNQDAAEILDLKERAADLQRQYDERQEELAVALDRMEAASSSLETRIQVKDTLIHRLETELSEQRERNLELTARTQVLDDEAEAASALIQQSDENIRELEETIQSLQATVDELQAANVTNEASIAALTTEQTSLRKDLADVRAQVVDRDTQLQDRFVQITALQADLTIKESQIINLRASLEEREASIRGLEQQAQDVEGRYEALASVVSDTRDERRRKALAEERESEALESALNETRFVSNKRKRLNDDEASRASVGDVA